MIIWKEISFYSRFARVMYFLAIFLTEIRASHAGWGSRASNFLKIAKKYMARSMLLKTNFFPNNHKFMIE